MGNIRVQEYGVCSYWPTSLVQATEMAEQIMRRNGCGNIQQRQQSGKWVITHRFELQSGLVAA